MAQYGSAFNSRSWFKSLRVMGFAIPVASPKWTARSPLDDMADFMPKNPKDE